MCVKKKKKTFIYINTNIILYELVDKKRIKDFKKERIQYLILLSLILWGPIICGPDPFIHWGPRPEPRKVIVQDR